MIDIKIVDYNYPLPDERIAKYPLAERDKCMLLHRRSDGSLEDRRFDSLPDLLAPNTMLVYNNTRVINARLRFHKAPTEQGPGSLIEIFCLEPEEPRDYAQSFASTGSCSWICFVGNSKKWKTGTLALDVTLPEKTVTLRAERLERRGNASVVSFSWDDPSVSFARIIEAAGEIPIPPYLNRSTEESDTEDYQTVFSHIEGSVAAPTAGLHFTPELLAELDRRGVKRREVTLHVGAGTFKPVTTESVADHEMHAEWISVPLELIREMAEHDGPIVAVGTTSVRTLESLYELGCQASEGKPIDRVEQWAPYAEDHVSLTAREALLALARRLEEEGLDRVIAQTRIIIAPGYRYRIVDGMITNFHQPSSTLLLLVDAFLGGQWRPLYDHALADPRYRFLSYGDACLLESPDN